MLITNITVLVIGDRTHIGTAMSQALNSQPAVRVVVAHNDVEAEKQTAQLLPTVICLQMNHRHSNAIAEIQRLKKLSPASRIVAITVQEDEQQAFAAIMAGAQGYCYIQEFEKDGILSVIQSLLREEFVLRPALRVRLMQRLRYSALGK